MSFLSLFQKQPKIDIATDSSSYPEEIEICSHNFFPQETGSSIPAFHWNECNDILKSVNEISMERIIDASTGPTDTIGLRLFDIFKDVFLLSDTSPVMSVMGDTTELHCNTSDSMFDELVASLQRLRQKVVSNPSRKYLKLSAIASCVSDIPGADFSLHFDVSNRRGYSIRVALAFIPCKQEAKMLFCKELTRWDKKIKAMVYQHENGNYFMCATTCDNSVITTFIDNPEDRNDIMKSLPDHSVIDTSGYQLPPSTEIALQNYGCVGSHLRIDIGTTLQEIKPPVMWPFIKKYKFFADMVSFERLLEASKHTAGIGSFAFGLLLHSLRDFTGPYGMSVKLRDKYVFDVSGYRHCDKHLPDIIAAFVSMSEEVSSYAAKGIGYLRIDSVGKDFHSCVMPDFYMYKPLYVDDNYPVGDTCISEIAYIPCKNNAKWIMSGVYPLSIARTDYNDDYPERIMKAACYEHMDGTIFAVCTYKNFKGQSVLFLEKSKKIIDILLNKETLINAES